MKGKRAAGLVFSFISLALIFQNCGDINLLSPQAKKDDQSIQIESPPTPSPTEQKWIIPAGTKVVDEMQPKPCPPGSGSDVCIKARVTLNLKQHEIAAVKFKPTRLEYGKSRSGAVQSTSPCPPCAVPGRTNNVPYYQEQVISEYPGDFTDNGLCSQKEIAPDIVIRWENASGNLPFQACLLDPNKEYYLNIRFFDPVSGDSFTCENGCGVYVDFFYQ